MPDVNQLHPWPDFLIVGTARSGTTALHEHLGKHPGIFVPMQKEPCYFTFAGEDPSFKDSRHRYTTTKQDYLQLGADCEDRLWGESSTPYLYFFDKSIANIRQQVPGYEAIRIIMVLRDPAERAYSQYMHNRRDLREPLSFEDAIASEAQRMQENWHFDFFYVDKGFYFQQVQAYLQAFDKVHIILFEEFEKDPVAVVNGVLDFLELPDDVDLGMVKKKNQSGEMKHKWIKRLMSNRTNPVLNGLRRLMSRKARKQLRNYVKGLVLKHNLKKVDMDPATRKQLVELYRRDIEQLQKLIGRDLSAWLR